MHCRVKEVMVSHYMYGWIAICGKIVRTLSDDNEASSVEISSGAKPLSGAQDSHCFCILVCDIWCRV